MKLVCKYRTVLVTIMTWDSCVAEATVGNFRRASIHKNKLTRPPEAASWVVTGSSVPCSFYHFPFPDPDVSFAATRPSVATPASSSLFLFSLWFEACLATPPFYILFTSLRQTKYHPPLFIKVTTSNVVAILQILLMLKNAEHMAFLVFSEEPSPEDSKRKQGRKRNETRKASLASYSSHTYTLWSAPVLLVLTAWCFRTSLWLQLDAYSLNQAYGFHSGSKELPSRIP